MDPFFRFGSRCRSNFCLPEQKKMFSSFSLFFFSKCWLISPTFLPFMSITVANLMCFFFLLVHMVRDWGRERLTLLSFLCPPCGRVCRYWIDYTQAKNAGQKAHYKTFLFRSKKKSDNYDTCSIVLLWLFSQIPSFFFSKMAKEINFHLKCFSCVSPTSDLCLPFKTKWNALLYIYVYDKGCPSSLQLEISE